MYKEPRYLHDCNRCVFLGQYKEFDLYVCPKTTGNTTIATMVARHGSDGPDYLSGLSVALLYERGEFPESTCGQILLEALRRARANGFTLV